MARAPFARPAALALLAALAFGAVTPVVRRFGDPSSPFTTAALLYAGAAIAAVRTHGESSRFGRSALVRVVLVAVLGAAVAPAALAWGIARTSASSASLLLNLEAVFTVLLARLFLREHLGARAWMGAACIVLGGVVVALPERGESVSVAGTIAVALATLAWAGDNVLTRPLSDLHPTDVVRAKASLGATLSSLLALGLGESFPRVTAVLALLACGALGFGASLRLYLRAQRDLGAARTGSLFALAPFVGVVLAVLSGERPAWFGLTAAAALMAFGVVLHVGEGHGHPHVHPEVEHEHAHRHDDGHHLHTHETMPAGEHTHRHRHAALAHDHPHADDVHHRHEH